MDDQFFPAISSDGVVCLSVPRASGEANTSRLVRLTSTSAYRQFSIAAPSTVSLIVATDAFVANHMFLLVKNRRSVCLHKHGRQIANHAETTPSSMHDPSLNRSRPLGFHLSIACRV
jgi:hypothetical protein